MNVRRLATTPQVQPRRYDGVEVSAGRGDSAVRAGVADVAAAEWAVAPNPEPAAPTRPAPATRDHDDRPRAARTEAPVTERRPGLDLHAVLSASRLSRSSALPAATIQRVVQIDGAEQMEGVARLPGLDVQRRRSGPLAGAATAVPVTVAEQTPRAALQLTPSPMRVAQATQAVHLPAPVMHVALPAPLDPPAAVQRITSVADPEGSARERLSDASDHELEELADRLYDHIRTRFRSELLIDRERAGLLADRY